MTVYNGNMKQAVAEVPRGLKHTREGANKSPGGGWVFYDADRQF